MHVRDKREHDGKEMSPSLVQRDLEPTRVSVEDFFLMARAGGKTAIVFTADGGLGAIPVGVLKDFFSKLSSR